jgi:hypothetical protein
MPYKDPEKQKAAERASKRRRRQAKGAAGVEKAKAEADLPKVLPDVPGQDELLRLLGVQARLGSVMAAKLLLDRIDKDKDADRNTDADPLAGVDELAERRAA